VKPTRHIGVSGLLVLCFLFSNCEQSIDNITEAGQSGVNNLIITESIKEFIVADNEYFKSCHASTLVRLENGDILAAWFAGTAEGNSDVAIWMSRRTVEGWQKPFVVSDNEGIAHWNPVLFKNSDNRIFLFYKEGRTTTTWKTMVKHSDDNGNSFSGAKELVAGDIGGRGPVKNKPIILMNGDIAAPASVESPVWNCFIDISRDGGETWNAGSFIPIKRTNNMDELEDDPESCYDRGVIQPTFWESAPGQIHALMRSTGAAIFRADSFDGGITWSNAYNTGLPNNNSGIDLVKLTATGGGLVLALNPVASSLPNTWGARTPLILMYSADNGESWEPVFTLEDEPGEYSYPSIIAAEDEIMMTYTWRRERIVFRKFRYRTSE
jgi:predicted neuraminidase